MIWCMNWIIKDSKKLTCHTFLKEILVPILSDIKNYNWIITDLEFISGSNKELPINHDNDYFILTAEEFSNLIKSEFQIVWGVIEGVPESFNIALDLENLPFAEGNDLIWKSDNIQYPDSTIEIVCFDSSYTIIKFKDESMSKKFSNYFLTAQPLEAASTWD